METKYVLAESIELRLGAALVRLQSEGAARVVAGNSENLRALPSPFGGEVRLASCCHSTERPKGESRDKTPFVVGRCAKPQYGCTVHVAMTQSSARIAQPTVQPAARHKTRRIAQQTCQGDGGGEATELFKTRRRGSKTQEAECQRKGPGFWLGRSHVCTADLSTRPESTRKRTTDSMPL